MSQYAILQRKRVYLLSGRLNKKKKQFFFVVRN